MEKTFQTILEIVKAKNSDYTNGRGEFYNFEYSQASTGVPVDLGICVRMSDKFARLTALLDRDPTVKTESLFDTIDDFIAYLAILKAWRQSQSQPVYDPAQNDTRRNSFLPKAKAEDYLYQKVRDK